MSWEWISFFLSISLSPKQKVSERSFQKTMDREGMNQSLGYWITSLPRKSDDRQILHQVTPSSTPKYLMLLDKVLPSVAWACWTDEVGADQSQGCVEFEELFGYLYLSFYFDLTWGVWRVLCLLGVTVTLTRARVFHYGTALWVRSHLGAAAEAATMS